MADNNAAEDARQQEWDEPGLAGLWLSDVLRAMPSWLVSMMVHVVLLVFLAVLTVPATEIVTLRELIVTPGQVEELEELDEFDDAPPEEINVSTAEMTFVAEAAEVEEIAIAAADDVQSAVVSVELSDIGLEHAPKSDLLASIGSFSGDALSGRGSAKGVMVAKGGGSEGSEKAVAMALKWLAEHQFPDGGWSFRHEMAPKCRGTCRNPGEAVDARNAATGLALLPFLGAGQTHKQGQYREVVKKGLYYLVKQMQIGPQGGSLYDREGRMYAHGICAIALCEAYAMTKDRKLYAPAQQAINFICYAQDPVGGGWRYTPQQRPGDTSVVGWQIMALKSGHMAYLTIPSVTIEKARVFLDTVQASEGAFYGYTSPGNGEATTAIGLLCRMYLGWTKDNQALQRGVKWIGETGPSPSNVYYNYYATQVMRHWEGEPWKKWNGVMRDQLVKSQDTTGHEKGSWKPLDKGHASAKGGRLYVTAMSTMILEVYYRHLPIFQKTSTDDVFLLD